MLVGDFEKMSVANNLRRRGLTLEAISDLCMLCNKEEEMIDHLLFHSEFLFLPMVSIPF